MVDVERKSQQRKNPKNGNGDDDGDDSERIAEYDSDKDDEGIRLCYLR